MPVQQQMSSFAKNLGGRLSEANEQHKDKPIDTGNRRLPPGIRDGVAKLSTMYTKQYDDDKNNPWKHGQTFFRASAIVMSPDQHNGEKVSGQLTSFQVPLCDVPAKGQRKATSFSENWYEVQNLFKLLGVAPCPETRTTDPTGQRTEAYFFAAMKMLTDPARNKTNPVYVSFSTRGWTPPASPQNPHPDEMVFETWHGLAQYNGQHNPATNVKDTTPASTQPDANSLPPNPSPGAQAVTTQSAQPDQGDPADVVASLVETAMADPDGAVESTTKLEQMAWANGWSKEQTGKAADWSVVGDMALSKPQDFPPKEQPAAASTQPSTAMTVTVGSKWMFAKRTKDGERLKDAKGQPFPPNQVEVVTVDESAKTCTVKTTKDGKNVVDIRSKQPVAVKFEWLEPVA